MGDSRAVGGGSRGSGPLGECLKRSFLSLVSSTLSDSWWSWRNTSPLPHPFIVMFLPHQRPTVMEATNHRQKIEAMSQSESFLLGCFTNKTKKPASTTKELLHSIFFTATECLTAAPPKTGSQYSDSSGYLGTHYVDKDASNLQRSARLCLPSAGTKDMCHRTRLLLL